MRWPRRRRRGSPSRRRRNLKPVERRKLAIGPGAGREERGRERESERCGGRRVLPHLLGLAGEAVGDNVVGKAVAVAVAARLVFGRDGGGGEESEGDEELHLGVSAAAAAAFGQGRYRRQQRVTRTGGEEK